MKIHFLGANRQVTGSRYCVETDSSRVMIDCGLFQERQYIARNWQPQPLPPDSVDALVLTHAHIDHIGLVPKFVKDGYQGPIHATRPTVGLAEIMLRDSAKIQMEDAEYKAKRHRKEGRKPRYADVPLYDIDDAEATLKLLVGHGYHEPVQVTPDVLVTFHDAGHILGSSILEVHVEERGILRTLVFSGDIGQTNKPLIRNPEMLDVADYLIMESTYGDRSHQQRGDIETQLAEIIRATVEAKGKLIIPTFAVERAQELMYFIARLIESNQIQPLPVFLDSPMAVDVTNTFREHNDVLDEETRQLISSGTPPLRFPGLVLSRTTKESMKINSVDGPCIIMSTSGMCTAGRIKHHLKHHIGDARNTILFVGYQAHGTLGRHILDGKPKVRIHGRSCNVNASVRQIYGFSGHADQQGLCHWAANFKNKPQEVFLAHGDEEAAMTLAAILREQRRWKVTIPEYDSAYDLD